MNQLEHNEMIRRITDNKEQQKYSDSKYSEFIDNLRRTTQSLSVALILTNLFWAVVLCLMIYLAWMSPSTTSQSVDTDSKSTYVSQYTEG